MRACVRACVRVRVRVCVCVCVRACFLEKKGLTPKIRMLFCHNKSERSFSLYVLGLYFIPFWVLRPLLCEVVFIAIRSWFCEN